MNEPDCEVILSRHLISGTWNTLSTDIRQEVLAEAKMVALEVGARLRDYLVKPELQGKRARADLEAERLIRERLTSRFDGWGFRAEEEPELNQVVDETLPFWLIDPNDGTSAFLKGERGASVSIALISAGLPVLGVIFAYAAPNNLGDLFTWAEGCGPLERNGHPISPQWVSDWSQAICFVSNSADKIAEAYQDTLRTADGLARYRVAPGIAYRLALCAAGEGEVAISLASPRDFDLAGGHALIRGAGGILLDERGQEIIYKHQRPHRLGFAFAGAPVHVEYASRIDWRLTFEAQRHPVSTPFLTPSEVTLSTEEQALDTLQGAWWGWHIGTMVSRAIKSDPSRSSADIQVTAGGDGALINTLVNALSPTERTGDSRLIVEARALCQGSAHRDELPRLQRFLSTLDEAISESLVETEQHSSVMPPTSSDLGLRWGLSLGRHELPTRVLSDLLSWREGLMEAWQPDGDRLIEQLGALLERSL